MRIILNIINKIYHKEPIINPEIKDKIYHGVIDFITCIYEAIPYAWDKIISTIRNILRPIFNTIYNFF